MAKLLRLIVLASLLAAASPPAAADCLVEYKAKRDNPLRLDYGFRALPDHVCTSGSAWTELSAELAKEGWILLSILSIRMGERSR